MDKIKEAIRMSFTPTSAATDGTVWGYHKFTESELFDLIESVAENAFKAGRKLPIFPEVYIEFNDHWKQLKDKMI